MSFSSELREAADALASRPELGAATPDLPRALRHIDGDDLVRLLRDAATLTRAVEKVRVIGAGILAERSARDLGQSGLAAKHGHRTPVEFVQSIGGVTRAEARRDVTLGASLLDGPGDEPGDGTGAGIDAPAPPDADRPQDWRASLRAALLNGTLSTAQHEAIQRGLGDPPEDRDEGEAAEVWRIAAEQLTIEAAAMPVEELARRARQVRDVLDAAGAEKRFAQRFERRSYRGWTDQDGLHHGHIVYDDEMAAWVRSITAAGLRPRRGGPRFRD